jgi:DNA-directed RNA polymerase specialized sigma24 family protein
MYTNLGDKDDSPDTEWLDIRAAGDLSTDQGREAFSRTVQWVRPSLLTHLTAKFRFKPDEADDLLQSFLHEKVVVAGILRMADPKRGRFRTFLLNVLDNFVLTELRRRRSLKRKPAGSEVSLEDLNEQELPHHVDSTDGGAELIWAQAVIAGTLLNMRAELDRRGRLNVWSVFEHRVLLPILDDQPPMQYSELVERFGFKSPSEAFNVLATAKRMFQRHLAGVVAEYASTNAEVHEELSHLKLILTKFAASSQARSCKSKPSTIPPP